MDNIPQQESIGGLNTKLERLIQIFESGAVKPPKEKKFKLPFGIRSGSKSKLKKGYRLVLILKSNRMIDIKLLPVDNELIYLSGNKSYHIATTDYQFWYGKYPAVIIPEWDTKPINPTDLFNDSLRDERLALPQEAILAKFMSGQVKPKKGGMGGKMILIFLVVGVVGVYILLKALGYA